MNRRTFLHCAQAACLAGAIEVLTPSGFATSHRFYPPIRLGVTMRVGKGQDPKDAVARIHELGFTTCQIGFMEKVSSETVMLLKEALASFHIEATAMMAALPGPAVYNFYDGPLTIGLIPEATRRERIDTLKATADMATECGIPAVHTHCGFIPENPNDPLYKQAVAAVREVAQYCQSKGRSFYCETGQETPVTLLRLIHDVGLPNVFVNLDVANFILYDKANPVDALTVLGPLVRGVHAKDGLYPTDPRNLGKEVAIGKGNVDFRRVIERLHDLHYRGAMTIEREIHGPQQTQDILASKAYLEKIISEVFSASPGPHA
jgi:L-ribulose-5-phosphate 3-epimerase